MFFLNKLIDNSRRKFPDVQILSFSYDDCKTLKLGAKFLSFPARVLTCSVSFLCSAHGWQKVTKPFMVDRAQSFH